MTVKNNRKNGGFSLPRRVQLLAALSMGLGMMAPAIAQQGTPLKIGVITPNTGGLAVLGDDLARNYELAADYLNSKGGVAGRQVQIIRADATTAQEGIAAVEKLVGRDKVDVVSGSIASFLATAASEAALNYNVLFWEASSLAKSLTERGLPNFVRSGPSTEHFAMVSVQGTLDMIAKKLGKKPQDLKVWLQHEDSAYGSSLAEDQKKLFEKAGVKVQVMGHSMKAIDLSDAILRAKNFAPDVWINAGYISDTNLLLRTAREQGFKPPAMILVGTGDTKETLNALGAEYLEGMILATYPRPTVNPKFGPGAAELAKAYEAKYKQPPVATSGPNGYVGMLMLARAIEAAGGSTAYKDVIAAAKKLDVPMGTYPNGYGIKFDSNMQNQRVMPTLSQWQNGQVVVVYPPEAVPKGASLLPLARK